MSASRSIPELTEVDRGIAIRGVRRLAVFIEASYLSSQRRKLLERIENLQSGTAKVPVIARGDRQAVAPCRRRDVAILDRHPASRFLEQMLLFRPDMGDRYVEAVNPAMHRVRQARQPCLQFGALAPFLAPNPICELRDHHRAGVAPVLFTLQPCNDARISATLRRLG